MHRIKIKLCIMRNKVVAGTKTLENSLFCKKIQLEGEYLNNCVNILNALYLSLLFSCFSSFNELTANMLMTSNT
ncbi:unnamed protein product [Tenebrio molitor]|nr:unnamed protein product [Tenebrio molitor]